MFLDDCYISFRLAFDITNESLRNTLNMWSMEMKYIHMYCKHGSISHSNVEIANMYFVNTFANKNRILYNRVPYPKESLRTFWWGCLKTLVHLAPINNVLLLRQRIRNAYRTIRSMEGIFDNLWSTDMFRVKMEGRHVERLQIWRFVLHFHL